jgi:DnaJ-class molecular chaperone
VEKNGVKGDQLVQVQVTVPEQLTPEQQEMLKRFAESAGMTF